MWKQSDWVASTLWNFAQVSGHAVFWQIMRYSALLVAIALAKIVSGWALKADARTTLVAESMILVGYVAGLAGCQLSEWSRRYH